MEVDFAFHAVAGSSVGQSGDIDLADTPDSELKGIALPHAVNMLTLEPFAGRLWFGFDSDEQSMLLEDTMNGSPGTGKVELVLDSSGSPGRVFSFEPDYPLLQRYGNRSS